MNKYKVFSKMWFLALLLVTFVAGCASNGTEIPVIVDNTQPTVSFKFPGNNATAVPTNTKVYVGFSKIMDPLTINSNTFTVIKDSDGIKVDGLIEKFGASVTFTPTVALTPNAKYNVTVTTGAKDLALLGNALASQSVWSFTIGAGPDATLPIVSFQFPNNNATAVPTNTKVYVGFSKIMDPATIDSNTFTVIKDSDGIKVDGLIGKFGTSATFTPTGILSPDAKYNVTVTTGAKDLTLLGNALASPSVWSFTTGAGPDATLPVVSFKFPADGDTAVPSNTKVYVGFSKIMDPLSINDLTFNLVKDSDGIKVDGQIDRFGASATFTPTNALTLGAKYNATVTTGAKDLTLTGNALATPSLWSFTVVEAGIVIIPTPGDAGPGVNLGTADTFGIISRDAMTLTVGVPPPHIYGDIALTGTTSTSSSLVGFALAGTPGSKTSSFVTGSQALNVNSINTTDNGNSAALPQLKADLETAYNSNKLGSLTRVAPAGAPSPTGNGGTFAAGATDLSGLILRPGIYAVGTSSDTFTIGGTNGPLVLDARGNADAVFVFQADTMASTLGSVLLQNGAQAKNVFWVFTNNVTIGTNTFFQGTIVAGKTITVLGNTNVHGRMLAGADIAAAAGTGNITVSGVISVPTP